MPYVQINTNRNLTAEEQAVLCCKASELITVLPSKKPERTMVEVNDGCRMYYGGNEQPCAKVRVELFRHTDDEYKKEYCEKLISVISETAEIDVNRIYMIFTEYDNWGSEGTFRR